MFLTAIRFKGGSWYEHTGVLCCTGFGGEFMSAPKYGEGQEIVVAEGDYKGEYGVILKWEGVFDRYYVQLPNLSVTGYFAFQEDEIVPIDDEEEDTENEEIPRLGMTEHEFVKHVEFLIDRSLDRLVTAGPETAFFGYQEFEGMTPDEVLFLLLDKLEDGIAHLAQTHVLVSRIGVALRATMQEVTGDDN